SELERHVYSYMTWGGAIGSAPKVLVNLGYTFRDDHAKSRDNIAKPAYNQITVANYPRPLNFIIDESLSGRPTLNVLVPNLSATAMSGGPNTLINLTYRLSNRGIHTRFISADMPMATNQDSLWEHFTNLTGIKKLPHV